MEIKVVYGHDRKIKVLKVDSKFKMILTAWGTSLSQELTDELHQIVSSEVECNRYTVYDMDSKKLMYFW